MDNMLDIDTAWSNFCEGAYSVLPDISSNSEYSNIPKCTDLYISTKTKISYLSERIDLRDIFWKIPVMTYHLPKEGVVKKQMKFNSTSIEEINTIHDKLSIETNSNPNYVDNYIIQHIEKNNSNEPIFKDIRKISIGLCKKDITSYKCKKKSAFYNCFVVILRVKLDVGFKEYSVKVFKRFGGSIIFLIVIFYSL